MKPKHGTSTILISVLKRITLFVSLILAVLMLKSLDIAKQEQTGLQFCSNIRQANESSFQLLGRTNTLSSAIENFLSAGNNISSLQIALDNLKDKNLLLDDVRGIAESSIWRADVNGDGLDDVIVNIQEPTIAHGHYSRNSYIWLFLCTDKNYEFTSRLRYFESIGINGGVRVGAVGDLTGDDAAEIVRHYINCGVNSCTITLDVLTFDSERRRLVQLVTSKYRSLGIISFNLGEYGIIDGNLEILTGITGGVSGGPRRHQKMTLAWDGSSFDTIREEIEAPSFTFQAILDGSTALAESEFDAAIMFFNRALNDTTLLRFYERNPPEQWIEQSAATYGLLLAFAGRDGIDAQTTQDALNLLIELPSDIESREYTNPIGQNLWQRYGIIFFVNAREQGLSFACEQVLNDMQATRNRVDGLGISRLYWNIYGSANRSPESETMCPF
jgi:hypothetical protein